MDFDRGDDRFEHFARSCWLEGWWERVGCDLPSRIYRWMPYSISSTFLRLAFGGSAADIVFLLADCSKPLAHDLPVLITYLFPVVERSYTTLTTDDPLLLINVGWAIPLLLYVP